MGLVELLLPLLIAACAVVYAVFTGRAQASHLRRLHVDVSNGTLRGHLVIVAVIVMVLATLVF